MATPSKQIHPAKRPRKTPALTRNGRVRYKGLNYEQLIELMQKTTIKKLKAKYMRRITQTSQLFARIPKRRQA